MAKLAIFLDHDILVRHFVLNDVLKPIEAAHDVVYVCPHNHKRMQIDLRVFGHRRVRTVPVSNDRAYLYRRLYHATVLKRMRQTTASHRQAMMQVWRHLLGPIAFWKSWLCSWPLVHELYKWAMLRKIGTNDLLENLLNEERPDVVIHPTVLEGLFVSDLIRWGEVHGTPTVFIMNSWDNPATKAMMVGAPSRLAVWGEQTKQHAIRHMHIPADRVVSLGVAQFDLYRHSPKEGPAEYRARLGIPLDKRVLLYAGSSKGLDETSHLRKLEEAIESGILEDCMVLYRPHPWRAYPQGETDFFSLNWKHVMLEPCMATCYQQYRLGKRMPVDSAKYEDTHVTLGAVDAVISPLSTILLEAAMHGKPIAVYLPDDDMKQNQHLSTVARMVHFTEFFEKIDCIKCERLDDLVRDCRRLLEKSREPGISDALKQQTAYFVEPSDQPYAERLNSLIRALLSAESRPTVQEA